MDTLVWNLGRVSDLLFIPQTNSTQPMLTNRHCKRISSSSSSSSIPMAVPKALPCHDLTHLSDFDALLSADDYISICGYGSLLSERSARSTFPSLVNFRIARLTGFRRLFNSIVAIFFTHGVANIKTEEIAGLSVEPCEGEIIILVVFEIKKTEIPAFIERERVYRFLAVVPESLDGKPFTNPAVLCASYTDEEFFKFKCSGNVTKIQVYTQSEVLD